MRETILTILGFNLKFQFTVYTGNYIEWSLHPDSRGKSPLFEILLRIHYAKYIEDALRECWFREEYEQHQIDTFYNDPQDVIF